MYGLYIASARSSYFLVQPIIHATVNGERYRLIVVYLNFRGTFLLSL